jgi:ABC-2 type transport system permease protein
VSPTRLALDQLVLEQ